MRQPTQVQGGHVQDQGRADPHFSLVNKAANHMDIKFMCQPTQVQGGHVQDQGRAYPHFLLVSKAANPSRTSLRRACSR
jgi:hypothetical protein